MKFLYAIFLLSINLAFSQSPAGIWYFGNKAGLNFNFGNNPVALNDSELDTNEGCATLCDENGNLLFYTDGIKVWNRNHTIMPNGSDLFGDSSSTQSAIIVPKPTQPNIYYVFTVDELAKSNGLNYSIIDLNQEGGLGDIISKNNQLATPCLEKITVVKHSNGIDFWVIAHKYSSNQFLSYRISSNGISNPIISNVGLVIDGSTQRTLGYMKSSPNGKFLACAHSGPQSAVQLFNFDNATGSLSLISTSIMDSDNIGAYGVEFSSNSKLLYVSNIKQATYTSQILQFNIESQNEATINSSKILVGEYVYDDLNEGVLAALQLAPNQKIYVARNNFQYLGAINNPNTQGIGCQFIPEAVNLGSRLSYFGLPSFITSYLNLNFTTSNFCYGDNTLFVSPEINNIISTSWNFGDFSSLSNTSTDVNPTHIFSNTGTFNVTLTIQTVSGTETFNKQVFITSKPVANKPNDYFLCEETTNTATFTLSSKDNEILGTQSGLLYKITYHLNLDDAENNVNPLSNSYQNISNPQTIFGRIQSKNENDCYDITNFQLNTIKKPTLEDNMSLFYCLNNYPQKINLSVGNITPSIGNYTYNWSTGETLETIQINEAGTYTVEVFNELNCSKKRTFIVTNSDIATINYSIERIGTTNNLIVYATGVGNYSYSLDNYDGPYQNSNVFNNISSGDHTIFVKDNNNCGISSKQLSVFGYPLFFSPNNDGINDTWGLDGSFTEYKNITIFDRHGKLVKILDKNNSRWDGTYIDKKLPSADYWFKVILNNDSIESGHFTLKR